MGRNKESAAAYARRYRAKLKAEGKCMVHPTRDVAPGHGHCQECLDKNAEKRAIDRETRKKQALCLTCDGPLDTEYSNCSRCVEEASLIRDEHKFQCLKLGVCPKHPEVKVEDGKFSCSECLKKERDRSKLRYDKAKSDDKCTKHKFRDVEPGHTTCFECLENSKENNTRRAEAGRTNGMCTHHPFRPAEPEATLCASCLLERIEFYHSRKEAGICVKHSQHPSEIGMFCEECWYKNISKSSLKAAKHWEDLKYLLEKQNFKCGYTGQELTPGINASIDHIIPKAKGGMNNLNNLHWIDIIVNWSKRDISHVDFLQLLEKVASNFDLLTFKTSIKLTRNYTMQAKSEYCKSHSKLLAVVNSLCLDCWFRQVAANNLLDSSKFKDVRNLFERQRGLCVYTGVILVPGQNASLDHITPRAKGGLDIIENLQWVDSDVNTAKYDRTHEEFLNFSKTVTEYQLRAK